MREIKAGNVRLGGVVPSFKGNCYQFRPMFGLPGRLLRLCLHFWACSTSVTASGGNSSALFVGADEGPS